MGLTPSFLGSAFAGNAPDAVLRGPIQTFVAHLEFLSGKRYVAFRKPPLEETLNIVNDSEGRVRAHALHSMRSELRKQKAYIDCGWPVDVDDPAVEWRTALSCLQWWTKRGWWYWHAVGVKAKDQYKVQRVRRCTCTCHIGKYYLMHHTPLTRFMIADPVTAGPDLRSVAKPVCAATAPVVASGQPDRIFEP